MHVNLLWNNFSNKDHSAIHVGDLNKLTYRLTIYTGLYIEFILCCFQEFVDLIEPNTLEDSATQQKDITSNTAHVSSLKVSSTQMTQIFNVHQKLYKHLVNTDWYQSGMVQSLQLHDWIKPILSSYTAATIMTQNFSEALGKYMGKLYC